jgi:hypothetical protein
MAFLLRLAAFSPLVQRRASGQQSGGPFSPTERQGCRGLRPLRLSLERQSPETDFGNELTSILDEEGHDLNPVCQLQVTGSSRRDQAGVTIAGSWCRPY